MKVEPRLLALLGLLALLPAAAYVLGRETIAAIAAVNVVLIVGCVYVALSADDSRVAGVLGVGE